MGIASDLKWVQVAMRSLQGPIFGDGRVHSCSPAWAINMSWDDHNYGALGRPLPHPSYLFI